MQQPKEETASATPPLPPREENAEPGSYDCWEDKKYFDEYAKLDIHCDMLHDRYLFHTNFACPNINPSTD